MAAEDSTRYGDLCRLCAAKTNTVLAINIFENEGAIRQINKKIETCLPIQVHETDELPKMICESCLYKLELFCDFRERSVRTENVLISLFKEISAPKLPVEQEIVKIAQPLDVAGIDHSQLIMIQHHHELLNEHGMQNVGEIDLSQLQQRDMIVQHEIILAHQDVDINDHSLANIDLDHHELAGQDLSNQETILVDETNGVPYTEENLQLIQQEHELLTEQYRLQHDLHVNITDNNAICNDITVTTSTDDHSQTPEEIVERKPLLKQEKSPSKLDSITKQEDMDNKSHHKMLKTNSEFSNVGTLIECGQSEECNSNESQLIVDGQFSDGGLSKDMYGQSVIPCENSNTSLCMSANSSNDGEWFHCNMCGKSFNEKMEFQLHYDQHFNKCMSCLAVFTNRDALNAHRKEMHGSNGEEVKLMKTRSKRPTQPVKKELDSFKEESNSDSDGVANLDGLEEEEDEDDPEVEDDTLTPSLKRKKWTPKECKECGKTYKTNYKLTEHMRKHTGEKPYKCNSCEKAFRSKIGLAQHEAKHTGQYDLACPTCGKGFQCKSYLMVHQRVHSDIKPYPCTTCGRNFKTKQSLLDHTNRHLGVKPYMCDICGRGFITKGLCKAHQKVHTGLDNRKYSCKVCLKMFVSKSYLQTHLRIHTGEKPFMCEVCGKGFLTRVDLRIHSTMHTGEKSYVCEMCGKAFARRDALRCHRRSHTGERPYSCDQCGQTFTQFSPMAIHKRLHTGERPYSCEVCGKTFVSRSTMMSHWKKHVR